MLLDPNDTRCRPLEAEHIEAGRAWWEAVSFPGETIFEVAQRLGMGSAEVSAIRRGSKAPPQSQKGEQGDG